MDSKELVMHTLSEEQIQDIEWWSEEDSVWWSKGKKGKKGSSKGQNKLSLVPFIKKKVKINNVTCTKDNIRIRRDKEKKVPIPS